MLIAIAVLVLITITVAALVLAPRLAEGQIVFGLVPDQPPPFGCRMAWLAIRTRDTSRVVEALDLVDVRSANWNTGLGTVYSDEWAETHVYVSPPVNGWTFVVGLPLPHPLGKSFVDKTTPLLLALGSRFIEVQYFFSYPVIDFFAWSRIIDGKLLRAYAIGDEGVIWNKGKPTREEKTLGQKLFELRGVKGAANDPRAGEVGERAPRRGRGRRKSGEGEVILYPTEDYVMTLAGKWSLNPMRLDGLKTKPTLGFVGRVPQTWRPELAQRIAA
jgi:hypothetical protein